MVEGGTDQAEDIVLVESDEDDWPETGPQKPVEAKHYREQVDEIFGNLTSLLKDDQKDALRKTVKRFKKLAARHLAQMSDADVDIIMKTIRDLACLHLR